MKALLATNWKVRDRVLRPDKVSASIYRTSKLPLTNALVAVVDTYEGWRNLTNISPILQVSL